MNKIDIDRVYSYTFQIPLKANEGKYDLDKKSPLDGCLVTHIATRRSGKSSSGKNLCNATAFASASLTLIKGSTKVHDELPLEHIAAITEKGFHKGVEVNLLDIDWPRSQVAFGNSAAVVTDEVIELTVYFVKK